MKMRFMGRNGETFFQTSKYLGRHLTSLIHHASSASNSGHTCLVTHFGTLDILGCTKTIIVYYSEVFLLQQIFKKWKKSLFSLCCCQHLSAISVSSSYSTRNSLRQSWDIDCIPRTDDSPSILLVKFAHDYIFVDLCLCLKRRCVVQVLSIILKPHLLM